MAETTPVLSDTWVRDFSLTWINRFSFFFAHHLTRPLLPLYLVSFGASSTVVGAVIGIFTVTSTVMRVPVGLYIDRLGRKPFLFYGLACLTAANFGYFWAPSILLIIPCRILHGAGWSGCSTAISTLAADIAPRARRGELIGYAGMASSLAGSLGPVAGFALFDVSGYSGVFLGAGGLLILALFLSKIVPEPKNALSSERIGHWTEALVVRETLMPAIAAAFLSFGQGGTLTFLPMHAIHLGLRNPGLWFGLYAFCLLLSRPIAGPLSDRISRRAVIIPGLIMHMTSFVLLALANSTTLLWIAAVIGGMGVGAAQPALMTLSVDQTAPQRRGQSMAQYQCFYDLGIGIGSLSLGVLLDLTEQSFMLMYLTTAAVSLLGLCYYNTKSNLPLPLDSFAA
ncbi:MAG TPA: MFS transporter [Terriglobales bacterium]|nr:MFS transporter [Terriglobales bacterium]